MKASSLIVSLCAALFALSGCSSPCESVCSSFNDCSLAERDHDVDCATFCAREQQFEETAAAKGADTCEKEFDAYISCWESNIGDICNAESTKCDASVTAWVDCMAKFCAVEANASDHACVVQDEGPALPALVGL
ncbi:hypothetical protein [Polyangium aurulentum]|uniref:hypothetical protein n=1 Tax=Polyangium aurulentum TaxID=2567896 RepID=UPI0010AEE640|nr:hypothetical protein [Polyangium aurulentum]UQA59815.1 hypothetical protein E8A73_004750 [Polyangium aurulentum]